MNNLINAQPTTSCQLSLSGYPGHVHCVHVPWLTPCTCVGSHYAIAVRPALFPLLQIVCMNTF